MGHNIHAIISRPETLRSLTSRFEHAHLVQLPQGFAMVPLIEELFDSLPEDSSASAEGTDKFEYLTPKVFALLSELSRDGPVVYCETEYHGGTGAQCATAWDRGAVVLAPMHSSTYDPTPRDIRAEPINTALRLLGVEANDDSDEFDSLTLGRFRSDFDWIAPPTYGKVS